LRLRRIFGELERCGLIHVLVRAVDESPDALQRGLKLALLEQRARFIRRFVGIGGKFVGTRRHHAIAITLQHRE